MFHLVLLAVFAYLVGAIPTGYILGRVGYGVNLQKQGSGNTGAANTRRVLGTAPAILVLIGDLGKAVLVLFVTRSLGYAESVEWWMGAMAIVGHIYPVYLRFKGGKGLATGAGVAICQEPFALAIFLLLWGLTYLLAKHGAISSVVAILGVLVYLLVLGILPGALACLVIAVRHTPEAWAYLHKASINA